MAIDKTGSTENIDSYKRVREPLSPQQNPKQTFRVFLLFYFSFEILSSIFCYYHFILSRSTVRFFDYYQQLLSYYFSKKRKNLNKI